MAPALLWKCQHGQARRPLCGPWVTGQRSGALRPAGACSYVIPQTVLLGWHFSPSHHSSEGFNFHFPNQVAREALMAGRPPLSGQGRVPRRPLRELGLGSQASGAFLFPCGTRGPWSSSEGVKGRGGLLQPVTLEGPSGLRGRAQLQGQRLLGKTPRDPGATPCSAQRAGSRSPRGAGWWGCHGETPGSQLLIATPFSTA